jgi:hypothetical protein
MFFEIVFGALGLILVVVGVLFLVNYIHTKNEEPVDTGADLFDLLQGEVEEFLNPEETNPEETNLEGVPEME